MLVDELSSGGREGFGVLTFPCGAGLPARRFVICHWIVALTALALHLRC
jgi:hypothetical protein